MQARRMLISVSLVVHVVIVVALFVAGSWHLEQLDLGKQVVDLRTQPDPPPAQGGQLVATAEVKLVPKHKVDRVVQPERLLPQPPAEAAVAPTGEGSGIGTGPGEGSGS